MNILSFSMVLTILPHLLREVSTRNLSLAFFHDFACTRMYMPLPFFPKQKPRYLKFRIANMLTVRLFSRFTFNCSFSSRYLILDSNSLSEARSLLASSTMSSALCRFRHSADYTEVETMPKLSFKHRRYHRFPLKISA